MKQFIWRLQRVLDIRIKEEQKKTAELIKITDKLATTRGELLIRKKRLENIINNLKEILSQIEMQQKEKIKEVIKVRISKEGLERLRSEAKRQFIKEQDKQEQKELDERALVSFVRSPIY